MRRRSGASTPWALAALAIATACSEPEMGGSLVVRDSAGVTIRESAAAVWSRGEGWRVEPEPSLDLGSTDGEGPTSFGRVTDAATLGSEWLVVADAMASELRIFGMDGRFRSAIGRPGQGPGEFRSLASVRSPGGDTIVVFDRGLRRLSWFRITGELLSTVDLGSVTHQGELALLDDVAPLGPDALVGREGRDFSGQGSRPGVTRDTAHFLVTDRAGLGARVVDQVPGIWTLRREIGGRSVFLFQPLTVAPQWTVKGDTLYVVPGEWPEVRVVGRHGVHRILRRTLTPRRVDDSDRTALVEGMLRRVPEEARAEARATLESTQLPERIPTYARVLVDPFGHVWAERFESPGLGPGGVWDVYDLEGGFLGPVETPSGLAIFEVGIAHVLGVWADDLDVPRVRVHALVRGRP